jgi:hypothetical protein
MRVPFIPSLLGALAALLAGGSAAQAADFEAVFARVSPEFVREKNPDGSLKPVKYAFGKGGYYNSPISDKSIDGLEFIDVAKVLAKALREQGYVPSKDTADVKLLIMVYWGTTHAVGPESASVGMQQAATDNRDLALAQSRMNWDTQSLGGNSDHTSQEILSMDRSSVSIATDQFLSSVAMVENEKRQRLQQDASIAALLGYSSWWQATIDAPSNTPQAMARDDMLNELEHYRYFIVLMAYDFQVMMRQKKPLLLWEERFSIRQQGNQFDRQLPSMVHQAAAYFGRNTDGLTHQPLPTGEVEIKEPSLIELDKK